MIANSSRHEIEKFDQLAKRWWDSNGPLQTLHHINPVRLAFIKKYLPLPDQKILDVGCGGGILSESLARAGAQVTGLDLSEQAIATARAHAKQQDLMIDYQLIDVASHREQLSEPYDCVMCMELLEHVPNPAELIQACADCVKPGGWVFFSTLNRTLKSYAFAVLGAEYLFGLLPKGTHDYQAFIKPSELTAAAQAAGLHPVAISGMDYDPFRKQADLCQTVSVNYLMCFQKR